MSTTGFDTFDKTVQQTNELLQKIEEKYGWQDRRNQSYAALRIVLQALRDRLPVNESAHLASQLPLLIRGVYFKGWHPESVPVKMDKNEFLERVR